MKSRILLLASVFLAFCFISEAYSQSFQTVQIGDGTKKFRSPVWSPDGTQLAF